ncbi:MAG TPA: GTPase HflX [Lachnospiraceae bacterium]|nr:GTPase HflX [Lachnospiraceae bacterium]
MAKETILYDVDDIEEKVILVGVDFEHDGMDVHSCLDELEELANTAGAVSVGRIIQKRPRIHPGYYLGSGKVEEIKTMVNALDATGIICDDELSPAQLRNLEKMVGTKIMDRTMVILDIFAARASSREGKIQVELAQLKYRLSRLSGLGSTMSRLGGGIGTRGPGEKKLEVDRRYIKDRISELRGYLEEIRTHRSLLRTQRDKKGTPIVSLVGYTNAGKSTILNSLTSAGVLEEDKLFATLDTTTRVVELPAGSKILLTDTVGFIQKLSHHLVEAFKATLEELKFADILLHVVDASNPNCGEHMEVVYKTLKDLGCENKPVITIFNKMDKDIELPLPIDEHCTSNVKICAKNSEDLQILLGNIEVLLKSFRQSINILIPYSEGNLLPLIHGKCEIISEKHTGEGVMIEAFVSDETKSRLQKYVICE